MTVRTQTLRKPQKAGVRRICVSVLTICASVRRSCVSSVCKFDCFNDLHGFSRLKNLLEGGLEGLGLILVLPLPLVLPLLLLQKGWLPARAHPFVSLLLSVKTESAGTEGKNAKIETRDYIFVGNRAAEGEGSMSTQRSDPKKPARKKPESLAVKAPAPARPALISLDKGELHVSAAVFWKIANTFLGPDKARSLGKL